MRNKGFSNISWVENVGGKRLSMYINKRRKVYYALHDIPADLRDFFGKARFTKTLKTDDKKEADRRAAYLEQKWLHQIERARNQSGNALERDAMFWREQIEQADDEHKSILEYLLEEEAFDRVTRAARKAGITDDRDPRFEQLPEFEESKRFYQIATGQMVKTDEHISEYLATLDNIPKTIDMKRSDLARMSKKFPYLTDISKRVVTRWVGDLQSNEGLKRNTVARIISSARGYWAYLQKIEIAAEEVEPFKQAVTGTKSKHSKTSAQDKRMHFEPDDVSRLLAAAIDKGDQSLADLIVLGMWTGCRIDELCALSTKNVGIDHDGIRFIEIADAKTEAGWRRVPVHSQLEDALDRLCEDSKDGYVLSGLPENKYGSRSNAIGKRFGNLRTRLGYSNRYVFHSIRKGVSTQLERAGVQENVTADILGHEKPRMTYGLYSGGNVLSGLKVAIEKLDYPQS